uniref:Holin of 3TMs, for gene-transfer release n=1 Tax=Candidatus Kentrum sp. LPFa TaxID=2126335 RepID=A0A450X1D0_9GAMM|nr:MAG: Holin of 3TMs, for gene-transfer release [Candidatus Kentron sp. LPFa]
MWDTVSKIIGGAAPVLGGLLGGPVGAQIGGMVASAIGSENTPEAIEQKLADNPELLAKLKALEIEKASELQSLTLNVEMQRAAQETARISEVNQTMRAELVSKDKFNSRWRAFMGYGVSIETMALVLGLIWMMIKDPASIANLGAVMQHVAWIISVQLAVVGVAVKKRSDDKALAAGAQKPGFLSGALRRFAPQGAN